MGAGQDTLSLYTAHFIIIHCFAVFTVQCTRTVKKVGNYETGVMSFQMTEDGTNSFLAVK